MQNGNSTHTRQQLQEELNTVAMNIGILESMTPTAISDDIWESEHKIELAFAKLNRVPIWVLADGSCLIYAIFHSMGRLISTESNVQCRIQIQNFCITNKNNLLPLWFHFFFFLSFIIFL